MLKTSLFGQAWIGTPPNSYLVDQHINSIDRCNICNIRQLQFSRIRSHSFTHTLYMHIELVLHSHWTMRRSQGERSMGSSLGSIEIHVGSIFLNFKANNSNAFLWEFETVFTPPNAPPNAPQNAPMLPRLSNTRLK